MGRLMRESVDLSPAKAHIAAQLLSARKAMLLSQTKLGIKIGVSYTQIQEYENANDSIRADRLLQLSFACKVRVGYFFQGLDRKMFSLGFPQQGCVSVKQYHDTLSIVQSSRKCIVVHVGQRMRNKREKLGFSCSVVAKKLGCTQSTLRAYEAGKVRASAESLFWFACVYKVTVEHFYKGLRASELFAQ